MFVCIALDGRRNILQFLGGFVHNVLQYVLYKYWIVQKTVFFVDKSNFMHLLLGYVIADATAACSRSKLLQICLRKFFSSLPVNPDTNNYYFQQN